MKSFEKNRLANLTISHSLLKTIRILGEYRGKQELYRTQSPQILNTLKDNAIIQSTESSNRIEGVDLNDIKRLKAIIDKRVEPANRPEQEIAGYRDVLSLVHRSQADIPFTPSVILQFHRDLFRYANERGGVWKGSDNEITETDATGGRRLRFKPVPAWQTAEAMSTLHQHFRASLDPPDAVEPLLATAAYVLDFLCIHPFRDGNGRMARLISLLLLYQAGYEVGRYVGLERVVEDTKSGYYDALYQSSQGWHEGQHTLIPWLEYFLGVMLVGAYREFESRVGLVASARGAKAAMIAAAIERLPMRFTISDVMAQCPTVGIDYVRKTLRAERDEGRLRSDGRGPDAAWVKIMNETKLLSDSK